MNIMHILSIGILSVLLVPITFADEVTDTAEEYRISCINALRIPKELSVVGTYGTRIQDCIDDRIKEELNTERRLRLRIRTEAVQQRIMRDSSTYIHRAIGEVPVQRLRFHNAQEGFKKLENNSQSPYRTAPTQSIGYERYVPETTNPINPRTTTEQRRSRRLIRRDARELSTTSAREASADAYEKALREALETCSDIQSNFHRTNCIRSAMRKAGSQ